MTADLTSRLLSDPTSLHRFYQSFELDSTKFYSGRGQWSITEFFPDTPIKMLKDVFEALKLYDLVELLERVTKPRTLHPALSLKEIENLQDASNRPTTFYSKAEVLIIQSDEADVGNNAERIGSFFKALNAQTQVTIVKPQINLLRVPDVPRSLNKVMDLKADFLRMVPLPKISKMLHTRHVPRKIEVKRRSASEDGVTSSGYYDMIGTAPDVDRLAREEEKELLMAVSTTIYQWVAKANEDWVEEANDKGWLTSIVAFEARERNP